MPMYEYDYVTIYTGGGLLLNNSACDHREIINRKAADGWRFVGYVPAKFTSYGGTKSLDLVFERPVKE